MGTPTRILVALLVLATGCARTGVTLRPDGSPGPEECPPEALKTMVIMQMDIGDVAGVYLAPSQAQRRRVTIHEGPIEALLAESLGTLDIGTYLVGKAWTAGPTVAIRFYEARSPRWGSLPICAVVRDVLLQKLPESMPGSAVLYSADLPVFVVDSFR